jgi:septum site-determining protein MinC
VICLPDDEGWEDTLQQLKDRLQDTASFFRGGRVALRLGHRDLSPQDIESIGSVLDECGVSLWSVRSQSEATLNAAREWGLEVEEIDSVPPDAETPEPLPEGEEAIQLELGYHGDPAESAVFVQRTLRSGQRVEHPGHVAVIGDVNPGAEIVAGGSVVIWGKLRGTVHAGASGDSEAVVCALSLFPTQLRIGNRVARSPESRPPQKGVPEKASIQDDEIVAEPWTEGQKDQRKSPHAPQ